MAVLLLPVPSQAFIKYCPAEQEVVQAAYTHANDIGSKTNWARPEEEGVEGYPHKRHHWSPEQAVPVHEAVLLVPVPEQEVPDKYSPAEQEVLQAAYRHANDIGSRTN